MATRMRKGFGCLAVVALPFLLGGAGLAAVAVNSLRLYRGSADWVPVSARVEQVELVESNSGAAHVDATYAYGWQGTAYRSDRVSPQLGSSADPVHGERATVLEKARAEGLPVQALVNPAAPGESLLYRTLQPSTIALLAAGLLFGLLGLLLFVMALRFRSAESWSLACETQFPGKPWRHERMWVDGTVTSVAGARLFGLWVVVVVLALFATPFAVFFLNGSAGRGAQVAVGGLVALWGLFVLLAVRATLSRVKHGTATLVLAELPIRPGHAVRGAVHWGAATPPQAALCRLRCLQSVTRRRRVSERDTEISVVFEHEWNVQAADWRRVADGSSMPVTLDVPAEASPRVEGEPSLTWWLEVSLQGPGVGAKHAFDLPVFEAQTTERTGKLLAV